MKIYTKTGDGGQTGLFGGGRVSKASTRVDAYGELDELNSTIGLARTDELSADVDALLSVIQNQLFQLGAELATLPSSLDKLSVPLVQSGDVEALEAQIDAHEAKLEPLTSFVLPAGCRVAAQLHVARCVCRRAERSVVSVSEQQEVRPVALEYLNRLSDLLFVLARHANAVNNVADVPWNP